MNKATIPTRTGITVWTLCISVLLVCGASWAGTVQGTAMYRERIALPPDAVFEAELQNISKADAPAIVLGRARLDPAGQTPFHFEISYDDAAVLPGHRYSVRATITHRARLLFTTDRLYPVLDGSDKPLTMLLVSARATEDRACSPEWYRKIEEQVPTGDEQAHGPDIGSDEWKSAIEFKLGVRGKPGVPERGSEAWCRYIDRRVRERAAAPAAQSPSFDCSKAEAGGIEAMICSDTELSALDRTLDEVYSAATKKAVNEHPPLLKAEQRGWIKGRDECWKSADKRACVRDEYQRRIAGLQARYRLVPGTGPFRYACDGNPANEVIVTFFKTAPATLIAEYGDSVSLMYIQPSASGAKYQGRNETFWEHQGEALITWGYGAVQMKCTQAP